MCGSCVCFLDRPNVVEQHQQFFGRFHIRNATAQIGHKRNFRRGQSHLESSQNHFLPGRRINVMIQHDVGDREDVFDELRRAEHYAPASAFCSALWRFAGASAKKRAEDEPDRGQ